MTLYAIFWCAASLASPQNGTCVPHLDMGTYNNAAQCELAVAILNDNNAVAMQTGAVSKWVCTSREVQTWTPVR